jgi:hypothetical protein
MGFIITLVSCVFLVLLAKLCLGSGASSGAGSNGDDPNQFVRDELDPTNPNNFVLRSHQHLDDDEIDNHQYSAANQDED